MASSSPSKLPASDDSKPSSADAKPAPEQKATTALGEDDEFEDFPVDDWPEDQTEAAQGSGEAKHLWEESWDDDDTSDDFSAQLKSVTPLTRHCLASLDSLCGVPRSTSRNV
ncbi:Putative 26S proteasome complex subunit sem-1 [Hirsutella minnesotensis 3608]|uniref:26S proteasome complex subunit SEM1 n=1 Tax=Hirsutella minnesotensis 3608 TaxID=1043627 RepID=A0A0F7ZGR8_9HYPO|nr:Putative 26S proteasome complex subunit sem-1 [Hirsutella minnesotensis 3608]